MKKIKEIITRFLTKYTITNYDSPYLTRWSLWLPFGYSIKLHKIMRTDDDHCEHDHPWWFVRVIVYGGYEEEVDGITYSLKPWRPWHPFRVYPCGITFKHRISKLYKDVNWTLVLAGPKVRPWGFYTNFGWKYWKEFVNSPDKIKWCNDETD